MNELIIAYNYFYNLIKNSTNTTDANNFNNLSYMQLINNYIDEIVKKENKLIYENQNNIVDQLIYEKAINKILSIIIKPFSTTNLIYEQKINLIENLQNKFKEQNMKNKFLLEINNILLNNHHEIYVFITEVQINLFLKYIKNNLNNHLILNNKLHEEIIKFYNFFFKNKTFNSPLIISYLFANNNQKLTFDELLANIQKLFNNEIPNFKIDTYLLHNKGVDLIKKWLEKNKIEANNNFINLIDQSLYLTSSNPKIMEWLLFFYVGFLSSKKEINLINEKLTELFIQKQTKSILNNQTNNSDIEKNKLKIINSLFGDDSKIEINKYILTNIKDINQYSAELDEYLKNEVMGWFINKVNEFINKNNFNKQYLIEKELVYFWKSMIYTIYQNKDKLSNDKLNNFIYTFLEFQDFNTCKKLKGRNVNSIANELEKIKNDLFVKSSYDANKSIESINKLFDFLNNTNDIDPICFVDNSLLSVPERFKWSYYEFIGDILYSIVINDLILSCEILERSDDNNDDYDFLSAEFQEYLCRSLNIKNNIQSSKHYSSLLCKEISTSDYLETMLYFIWKKEGYKKVRSFILELFNKNAKECLVKKNIKEWVDSEFNYSKEENEKYFSLSIIEPKYYFLQSYFATYNKKSEEEKFNKFKKLMKKIYKGFLKIEIIVKNKDTHYNIDYDVIKENVSFGTNIDQIVSNKFNPYFSSQMKENSFYINLYNLFINDFDEFNKKISSRIEDAK